MELNRLSQHETNVGSEDEPNELHGCGDAVKEKLAVPDELDSSSESNTHACTILVLDTAANKGEEQSDRNPKVRHQESPVYVEGLDMLRFVCAVGVALWHAAEAVDSVGPQEHTPLWAFSSYGTYMFFVVSGASLHIAHLTENQFNHFVYICKRFARLMPLLLISGIANSLFDHLGPRKVRVTAENTAARYFLSVTFYDAFGRPGKLSEFVGGAWTLGVEWNFYILFPFLRLLFMRQKPTQRIVLKQACFVLLVGLLQVTWVTTVGLKGEVDIHTNRAVHYAYVYPAAFMGYFVGGIFIASHLGKLNMLSTPLRLVLATAAFLALMFIPINNRKEGVSGFIGFGFLLITLFVAAMSAVPRLPGSVFLGRLTYGFYLWNMLVIEVVRTAWPGIAVIPLCVIVIIALFVIAYLSERLVERPAREWIRKWLKAARY